MIYISRIQKAANDCNDDSRWMVVCSNPDGSEETFKCRTCELAVEFALFCSAQRRFVGNPDFHIMAEGAAAKRVLRLLAADW
jgi:hypothetical protein